MIRPDDLTEIGSFHKPHGIKGELSAGFDYEIDPDNLRCVIVEIDGIYVPFFIESWRGRGNERFLIKLEGVDDENSASAFSRHPIYALTNELDLEDENDDEGMYLYDMIGFTLFDGNKPVGVIKDIDDTTENILFHVEDNNGRIIFVPFADDWTESFDQKAKTITMNLPEGILDLNN